MGELRRAWHAWQGLSWRGKAGTAAAILAVGAVLSPSDPPPEQHGVTAETAADEAAEADDTGRSVARAQDTAASSTDAPSPSTSPSPSTPATRPPQPSPAPDAAATPAPAPTVRGPRGDDALALRSGARVTGIVDGDTLDLADGTRVRLAVVDTPEVHGGLEACGPEASAFAREFVLGEAVTILRPSAAPVTDPYDRLLGEVVRDRDGASFNVALAAAGLGEVDERYTHEDPDLAARARAAAASAPTPSCAAATPPPPTPRPEPEPEPAPGHTGRTDGGWDCHPAYRECLPAGHADLDCADVGHQVVLLGTDDPWRLDGNSTSREDGVGCESYPAWSSGGSYPYG